MQINPCDIIQAMTDGWPPSAAHSRAGIRVVVLEAQEDEDPDCSLLRIFLIGTLALSMLLVTLLEMTLP